ncbi:hypothetical protein EHP00_1695 [Ecytonucleospora hepatopenaei]|uniref:Large ribosomal subunit protein eL24-related N-terminal domain-containing protein n=1 Tax=Ecytonucleospora hepatopenaei TaxID=646526 RepID=A0A1W0E475_9MICR|nr:hypothetical protein EHP00_1695 [Ecytonucleospora hepatopenaei]
MYQGQSIFSGLNVPRGSGLHTVLNDGRVQYTANRKERNFLNAKVSARNVKWTESSRAFFKKNNKTAKVEQEIFTITKKVRGFAMLPGTLMNQKVATAPKTSAKVQQGGEKVGKNSNMRK